MQKLSRLPGAYLTQKHPAILICASANEQGAYLQFDATR